MAENLTTCRVLNKHDDLFMTLCTEWSTDSDSSFKIIVLSSDANLYKGEVKLKDVEMFAKELPTTITEYLALTRKILSGKGDSGFEFILKDSKLRWKKDPWNYAMIDVRPASLNEIFPTLIEKLLTRHEALDSKFDELKTENEELKNRTRVMEDKIEEIIDLKNRLENDLYTKFLVVLNSKKEKIRELEAEIKNKVSSNKNCSVYEVETDDGETSDKEDIKESKTQGVLNSTNFFSRISGSKAFDGGEKLLKRQMSDSDERMIDSDYEDDKRTKKKNSTKSLNRVKKNKINQKLIKPSTSNNHAGDKISRTLSTPSVSKLNLDEVESDEDIFS